MVTIFTQDALLWSTIWIWYIYACVNYWFVVLVNNVSIPCKCICYEITEVASAHFYNARERFFCNILYKIRKRAGRGKGERRGEYIYHRYHKRRYIIYVKTTYSLLNNIYLYIYINMIHEKKPHEKHIHIYIYRNTHIF